MTEPPPRKFVPLPPEKRPWKVRSAVRVVVLAPGPDGTPHVLLFEDSDPAYDDIRWWVTPGGGIDPGETETDAAVRELEEETGLVVTQEQLIGPVSRRVAIHGYSDEVLKQDEAFYLVRVDHFEVDTRGHTLDEQITLQSHRWWPLHELATTDAWIWPRYLMDLIASEAQPEQWPVDYGEETDESTQAV